MVVSIQQELRSIFLKQSNITENIIFLDEMTEAEFNTPPWINILPYPAEVEPAWKSIIDRIEENGKSYNVQQKYKVLQPVFVRMVFENKAELNNVVDQFLVDLPKSVALEKITLELQPKDIDYIFAQGALDVSVATIQVTAEYPVLKYTEINKISNINIQTKS